MTHPFERAGLGKAPFRFVGVETRVGPMPMLDSNGNPTNTMVGSPGQPLGTCAFCGQSLAQCCFIKSADGKTFMVGNVCVYKTGDTSLEKPVKDAVRERQRKKRHEREDQRIQACRDALKVEGVREALNARPHPMEWRAENGDTLLSWALWMMGNAGNSGRIRVCRIVEKIQLPKSGGR